MRNYPLLLFAATLLALQGCADLQHVNSFSNTAVTAIRSYDDIGYNFTTSYYTYTQGQNAYALSGNIAANSLNLPAALTVPNEPKTAIEADQAITFYMTSIASYFEALAELSNKDLVNYNFDEISKNLKADQKLKSYLKVTSDDQVDAAAKIASVFTNELMGAYRERKVRRVMIDYDDAVSKSIQTLMTILTDAVLPAMANDNGLVDVKYQVILKNPKIDLSKKAELTNSYNEEKIKLDTYKTQIGQFIEALTSIKEEHNQTVILLKDNKLTAKEVKDVINQHAAEVYQLYTSIKTLTTKSN